MKIIIYLLLFASTFSRSQGFLDGLIRDAKTRQPIPAANVQIHGTFRGTVSNLDGRFQLKPETWPTTVRISHIGYLSQTLTLPSAPKGDLDIGLQPSLIKMGDMVITAEDPAFNIMRKAIAAKKEQRQHMRHFKADAYTRLRAENDTAVVMISESKSKLYWDCKKGTAEKILSKVQTLNLEKNMRAPEAGHLPNLSDDNISMFGFTLIGPTHPDALDYYDFKLEGRRSQDGKVVYDIALIPKTKLQPCFSGSISIIDEAYALVEAEVASCNIHPQEFYLQKIEFTCRQQFSRFDSLYWLPIDCQQQDVLRFGIPGLQFPTIKITRLSSLDNYEVNGAIPDSVFSPKRAPASSFHTVPPDSILTFQHRSVPLTFEEVRAYKTIDSTMTIIKGFKPSGYLSRYVKVEAKTNSTADKTKEKTRRHSSLSPQLGFNRVDGLQTGAGTSLRLDAMTLAMKARYHWASKKWASLAELLYQTPGNEKWKAGMHYADQSLAIGSASLYPQPFAAIASLLGQPDYFDYYWNQEMGLSVSRFMARRHLDISLAIHSQQHSSLTKKTDFSLFKKSQIKRDNPAIDKGRLNAVALQMKWGEQESSLGMVGQTGITLLVEHSLPSLGGNYSFTRYESHIDLRVKTLYTRYLFPNTLDIKIRAGGCSGRLPVQLLATLDGRLGLLAPFGSFKTHADRPIYGDHYLALFWEHNFRGAPLQWIGLSRLADKGVHILIHGGSGRTWLKNQPGSFTAMSGFYHEIGFSINGILTYLRCDVSARLTGPRAFFITLAPRKLF